MTEYESILKKLEEGFTVIVDRYYFSSYAYQGTHMSMDWVIEANSLSAKLLRPDLNIFIDIPTDVSIARIKNGRSSVELYETKENLQQVREKYMEAFEKLSSEEAIYITDGNRPAELIAKDIWQEVSKKMELQDNLQ